MNPISRIRRQYKNLRAEDKHYRRKVCYDDEGREIITLQLDHLRDAFSRFSPVGDRRINPEVKDYLISQNRRLGPLVVNVRNAAIAGKESMREGFRKTVSEEFRDDCARISRRITFNWIKSWLMLVVGIAILLLSTLGEHFSISLPIPFPDANIILRTADVLAWVVLWEAFDGLIFTRSSLRMDYLRAARLRLAEFLFTE
ncbi:MAG: hypothetical protein LBL66_05345 [Clostridiales bacterium]|jgi:hypothetical protein|nr:hypothetical protein [Clostridiales bacterium]